MNRPKRIQRKRTKGWKMPEGAVYVGRPGKFGNPFKIKSITGIPHDVRAILAIIAYRAWIEDGIGSLTIEMEHKRSMVLRDLSELRGRDLACWCKEGEPCHADVLLELANRGGVE